MRNLIWAVALVTALAAPAAASAETAQEHCSSVASVAHTIMRAHQNGVPLSDILSIIEQNFPDPEYMIAYQELAVIAYGEPRFHTEAAQQRGAADFRDAIHVWCLS